jgi:hypothetical protein
MTNQEIYDFDRGCTGQGRICFSHASLKGVVDNNRRLGLARDNLHRRDTAAARNTTQLNVSEDTVSLYKLLRNNSRYCYIEISVKFTYNIFYQGYSTARRIAAHRIACRGCFRPGFNCTQCINCTQGIIYVTRK